MALSGSEREDAVGIDESATFNCFEIERVRRFANLVAAIKFIQLGYRRK